MSRVGDAVQSRLAELSVLENTEQTPACWLQCRPDFSEVMKVNKSAVHSYWSGQTGSKGMLKWYFTQNLFESQTHFPFWLVNLSAYKDSNTNKIKIIHKNCNVHFHCPPSVAYVPAKICFCFTLFPSLRQKVCVSLPIFGWKCDFVKHTDRQQKGKLSGWFETLLFFW